MEQALINTVIAFKLMQYSYSLLDFVEKLWEFQHYAVLEKKIYFREFVFYNFRYKIDKLHGIENWDFNVTVEKNLSHLSYSQRLHY